MRFVIVTGMSGAGKSSVMNMLEDIGYFCVDNLPVPLIPKLARLAAPPHDMAHVEEGLPSHRMDKIALGVDIRTASAFEDVPHALKMMKKSGYEYELLFLDASDEVLVKRYKETRRTHPLAKQGRMDKGIAEEREKLAILKDHADYIIDTSQLLVRDLKAEIDKIFVKNETYQNLVISIVSFGFKYGIPMDCDLVFDVRFLPNPYYVPALKMQTGNEKEVYDFVMRSQEAGIFLDKLYDMVTFLFPNYVREGKNQLVIGIGCTGGRHRSVTLANALYRKLRDRGDIVSAGNIGISGGCSERERAGNVVFKESKGRIIPPPSGCQALPACRACSADQYVRADMY